MATTDVVTIYRATRASETLAVVIPKRMWESLELRPGDRLRASVDSRGRLVYRRAR